MSQYLFAHPWSRIFHNVAGTPEADDDSYAERPTFLCNGTQYVNDLMKIKLPSEIQKPNRRCVRCRSRAGR